MNDNVDQQCCETPIQDLLRRIPKGLTIGINDGEYSWSNHPVADLAYRAADQIDILRHRLVAQEAVIKHLKSIAAQRNEHE